MKRILKWSGLAALAAALAVLAFPPTRRAVAEAIASAVGVSGQAAPTLTLQVGGSDGTSLRALPVYPNTAAPSAGTPGISISGYDSANNVQRTFAVRAPGAVAAQSTGVDTAVIVQDIGAVSNPAIYDVTSAVNTALDTGILDVSAWRSLIVTWLSGGVTTVTFTAYQIDDAGGSSGLGNYSPAAAGNAWAAWSWGVGCNFNTPLPRRVRLILPAVPGQSTRLRIEGRR